LKVFAGDGSVDANPALLSMAASPESRKASIPALPPWTEMRDWMVGLVGADGIAVVMAVAPSVGVPRQLADRSKGKGAGDKGLRHAAQMAGKVAWLVGLVG
jgi:hypothetical protein